MRDRIDTIATSPPVWTLCDPKGKLADVMGNAERQDDASDPANRWSVLPEQVSLEEQVISMPASDAPDVNGGRNPDHEWLIRGL